jgi:hypothetical protein
VSDGTDELGVLAARARAPRAAGVAGVAFAAMLAGAITLFRSSIPVDPDDAGRWLTSGAERTRVEFGLALLPFAGIAFLWFIGVIRDHLGDREDRFFATVFLGSGLLFVAMLFISGATMATLVGVTEQGPIDPEVWRFGRRLVFTVMNTYGLRMAAVFAIATTTLSHRLGVLPRWLHLVGYLSALALLLASSAVPWLELLFPLWVMLVSIQILLAGRRALETGPPAPDGPLPDPGP